MKAEFSGMKLGLDVMIAENAFIKNPDLVTIGNHCAIDHGFYCTTGMEMGDYVHIAPYVTIIGGAKGKITLKDFSSIAAQSCCICSGEGPDGLVGPFFPEHLSDRTYGEIVLEPFANIYTNCTIVYGVTMAPGSTLAGNSLLIKNTEPWTIYGGSPAKPIGKRNKDKILGFAKEMGYDYDGL